MLHITAILEDNQIVLKLDEATQVWHGTICDGHTGREVKVEATSAEVSAIFALALDHNGEPLDEETTAKFYKVLEPWTARYGMQEDGPNVALRPIP